jgi:phage terminase small subunit
VVDDVLNRKPRKKQRKLVGTAGKGVDDVKALDSWGLTRKARAFCDAFLVDSNRSLGDIYTDTHKPAKTMTTPIRASCGAGVLRTKAAQKYIKAKQRQARIRNNLDVDRVVQEFMSIGLADIGDLFDAEGRLLPIKEMPEGIRRSIAQVDVVTNYSGSGKNKRAVGQTTKIRMVDKKGALDSLARILGMFKQDRMDTGGISQLMAMITKDGSTIGRIDSTRSGSRALPEPGMEAQQPLLHPGQKGQQSIIQAQSVPTTVDGEFLVSKSDT